MICQTLTLLLLATFCPPCLLTPLSKEGDMNPMNDAQTKVSDEVRELESLRITNKSTVARPDIFSLHAAPEHLPTPLPLSDAPQTNSRSAIFRHRGITEAKKNYWKDRKPQTNKDDTSREAGLQYSPIDLAIYVFKTGDEEGVALAVEELVREGMMGRTDAINYLQDVKQILSFFKDGCSQRKSFDDFKTRAYPKPELTQRIPNPPREQFISMDLKKREPVNAPTPLVTTEHPHEAVIASTSEPKGQAKSPSTTTSPKTNVNVEESFEEERLKNERDASYSNEDAKRKEPSGSEAYALQTAYKLAKEMITKSILRDAPSAEDILTELTDFLEMEVGNNRISSDMKEQVLDVVSAALVDSMKDLFGEPGFDESGLYSQLSKSEKTGSVPTSEMFDKEGMLGIENMRQLAQKSNRPKSS